MKGNIFEIKWMSLKQIVWAKIPEICTEVQDNQELLLTEKQKGEGRDKWSFISPTKIKVDERTVIECTWGWRC
jgi:hypothetical protein